MRSAEDWIKAINEATTDQEVIKLWHAVCTERGIDPDNVTLKVHRATARRVLAAINRYLKTEEDKTNL